MALIAQADARHLPFPDGTFDLIFGSVPFDHPDLVMEARSEFQRVLTRKGRMAFVLPNLDNGKLATLAFTNRDWSERQQFAIAKPMVDRGWKYGGMAFDLVRNVVARYGSRRILDPFCGTGPVMQVARRMGLFAVGVDIDAVAAYMAGAA